MFRINVVYLSRLQNIGYNARPVDCANKYLSKHLTAKVIPINEIRDEVETIWLYNDGTHYDFITPRKPKSAVRNKRTGSDVKRSGEKKK